MDATSVAAILAIFGALSGAFRTFEKFGRKLYWWIAKFFTASVTIDPNDILYNEIHDWLGSQVLERRGARILTATSEAAARVKNSAYFGPPGLERRGQNDIQTDGRPPIQYLPIFETTWFVLERNIYLIRRTKARPAPPFFTNNGPLTITCMGRSVAPLKQFLGICREFADKQSESFTKIYTSKECGYWDTAILRPLRKLETVNFDEEVKKDLVADIEDYLDADNRRFYMMRGIPYRRGYLLHGPPGTGKTSLSLAIAGKFGLELYLVHLPSINSDHGLA